MFELDAPLASTNSSFSRVLGTFPREGRSVTSEMVPGYGTVLGTELLQVEGMQGNVVFKAITYRRAPWLTTHFEV